MDFIENIDMYYEFLKIYFVGSSLVLCMLFLIALTVWSTVSRIERKIDSIRGDVADIYDRVFNVKM